MKQAATGSRAATRTYVLAAALAVGAAAACLVAPSGPTVPMSAPTPIVAVVLALAFFLGEQMLLNVEFRKQAHSLTLAGLPLVIGVLVLPIPIIVIARVLGAGAALLCQRVTVDKVSYNVASWAFEAATATLFIRWALGRTNLLTLGHVATVLAIVVALDQLMSCLVLLVIRMHGGTITWSDVRDVLGSSLLLASVSSAMSVGVLLLTRFGAVGAGVMLVVALVMLALYRGYLRAMRRHQRLELLHEFVTDQADHESFTAVVDVLLKRIRALLRAGTATLVVTSDNEDADGEERVTTCLTDDVDDGFTVGVGPDTRDWISVRVVDQDEPMLAARTTKDPAVRTWLQQHGWRDAAVVPLPPQSGFVGTLTVSNRLGETSTFTSDDVTLLQTLVGHLVVAGRSAQLVERLAFEATHDALTGLANRNQLTRSIADATRSTDTMFCVMLLDLDRFKEVNDSLGHGAGDELLRVLAARLTDHLPADATIARLGGDEFAILLPLVANDGDELDDWARTAAVELSHALAIPVVIEEALLTPDVSIGVAVAAPGLAAGDLLRRADVAMYAAKGRDEDVAVFHAELDRGRLEDLALLADLRIALRDAQGQIDMHYQPKLDLRSRTVVSAEALVRWHHPLLGVIMPDRFIPLAESAGLIDQFTPLVLHTALTQCRRWRDAGHEMSVAINLSARNVSDPRLPDRIDAALRRAGVPARALIVEITESTIVHDRQQTLLVLDRLAGLGVTISLDDFGTGYSSLSYLQRLPVHEIKIDRSFVLGLTSDDPRPSEALIGGIAELGGKLGLRVVAEGAESYELMDRLQELGCDVMQGYCLSRPLPSDKFAEWLDAGAYKADTGASALRLVTSAPGS